MGISSSRLGYPALWLLWNLLCHLLTAVVSPVLLLREGEENGAENVGEVVPGESSQEPVASSIHQQDKHSGVGNGQGRVKGLGDLYGEVGKHLVDEDTVAKEGYGLGKDGVVVVQGGCDDPLVEDRVGQDVDQEDFSLGDGKAEEVDGDFVGRGVEDRGHNEMEGACFMECLISSTSRNSPCWYQTASACPSNWGQCSEVPMR